MTPRKPRRHAKKVVLTGSERKRLQEIQRSSKIAPNVLKRVQALVLLADGWAPMEIPKVLGCGEATVRRARQRFEKGGIEGLLIDGKAPGAKRMYGKKEEQRIVALVCSDPPDGCSRWTVRLIAEEAVKRKIVPKIGKDTVHLILQSHDLKPWREKNVVCPQTE